MQATEISVNDYYPFGLNMDGRGWQSVVIIVMGLMVKRK